jgi:superfamily II DNA or RNA helicase
MPDTGQLEEAIWTLVSGRASPEEHALLLERGADVLPVVTRLIDEVDDDLEHVRGLRGDERDQVVADFLGTIQSLQQIADALRQPAGRASIDIRILGPDELAELLAADRDADDDDDEPHRPPEPPEPVSLQGSWEAGNLVIWAAGRGMPPAPNDELADRLEACGGPPHGWAGHAGVALPAGDRAEALSISIDNALGWLAAVGSGQNVDGVGAGLVWLGRVALEGIRQVARGAIVPGVHAQVRTNGRGADARVHWRPALLDDRTIEALSSSMPNTVVALTRATARSTTIDVMSAVVDAIARAGASRLELPAQPPRAVSATDLADTIRARMDGKPFAADRELARDVSKRLDRWAGPVVGDRHPLVVRLDPPGVDGVWMASVHAPTANDGLVPIDEALRENSAGGIANEWARIERAFPPIGRSRQGRGRVVLTNTEAWDFMTGIGPMLASIGIDVRAPELSRHAAKPSLHLFTEARAGSLVGANQLSAVSWSIHFDDVELTAADIARLSAMAKPLIQSRGKWVSIDRVDLEAAATALAERQATTEMTGAEILRHSVGLDGPGLSGGIVVHGDSWANDIIERANQTSSTIDPTPETFSGTLRSYQSEALTWIGFLDGSELGGCLALDMGLGKTPTVLAHLARTAGEGTALVIAPAAVVGNWAAEAAKFTPDLRVVVHHGANRATARELGGEIAGADIVITTYATAVRDVDALAALTWRSMVLDEAQAIKNHTSDTAQQLRRIPARTKLALTGTPIENGVGDLWAILDFTNPALVGPRPAFIAQLAGDGETALKALNGILLFRRTKTEPEVAAELPDKIDELDHCTMTQEQIGLYQAVLDDLVKKAADPDREVKQGAILAAITALKQICNHPAAFTGDDQPLAGRSGKLVRLEELIESVFEAGEKVLVFTHFAQWGRRLATHLTKVTGQPIECYDGDLSRTARDRMVAEFQTRVGPGAMVLSLKAGGTGLNLTAANHVVLYDRWWNPAVEDQARDRAWRIGQTRTVISHRLVCPGTVDERVEEVVQGKRHIANIVLPKSSSIADLDAEQLRKAFGLRPEELLTGDDR